jgi:hypothetical protein
MREPFEYAEPFYNEAVYYLQQRWNRELSSHEIAVLIEGYRFGRYIEMQNEIRILESK